jgi:hypothetical protein
MTESRTLKLALAKVSAEVDGAFDRLLQVPADARARVDEAMR